MLEETTGPQLQTAQFRLSGVRPEEQTTSEQMMAPQMEKEGLALKED
ncbi:unnamed protein product [Tetraodon nigroviridis]|uniref:(spotted green pufferfish) hypothetical protein n=1 Tax=Tetraodon nigroviridis TaxID=99883 RepID=Q4RMR8_TETNG|nr:unnamed protein product [Tetraodon nigroviridis]